MCRLHRAGCECEGRMASVYHRRCVAGYGPDGAFAAAVAEFRRLHPNSSAWEALGAAKDVLSRELDAGVVDCGDVHERLASKLKARRISRHHHNSMAQ